MNPSIAIVVLNWNGLSLLKQFIPAVIANSQLPGVRVIVADNASTDGSVEWLKANLTADQLIFFSENHGFAKGYNKALSLLNDDYFILLNSDAVPGANWLPPFFNIIEKKPLLGAAMPKIKSHKNPSFFEYAGAAGGFIDKYGFPFCRGRIFDVTEEDKAQYNEPSEIFWASGAAFLVKADLYKQLGGLDETFFAHMEEIDLCWRLKNRGYHVYYIPQSEVFHIGGASLHQSHPHKTFLNFRNNLFLLLKNLPSNKLYQTLFLRMLLDGVAALKFLLSFELGFFTAVLKAHLSFYAHFRHYSRFRKNNCHGLKNINHPQVFNGSIVFQYFVLKKDVFSKLKFKSMV